MMYYQHIAIISVIIYHHSSHGCFSVPSLIAGIRSASLEEATPRHTPLSDVVP